MEFIEKQVDAMRIAQSLLNAKKHMTDFEKQRLCIISTLIDMEATDLSDSEIERCLLVKVGGSILVEEVKRLVRMGYITENDIMFSEIDATPIKNLL